MDAIFNAVDVTTLSTNVTTLLTAFVVVNVIFLGYRYVRRTLFSA